MSRIKKRKCLTFEEKFQVLKKVRSGVPKEVVMREYEISNTTYYRLIDSEPVILKNLESFETINKKSLKSSDIKSLDAVMIKWFQQVRDKGDPVSGPILQEKALIFNEKLNGPSTFKASNGWLKNFKKRYGIRGIQMKGDKLYNNDTCAQNFSNFLKEKIESEDLSLENIYNADESGIYWRTLALWTLASCTEEEVSGQKEIEERVTALFCSNVSGNHRIPLLTIGNSKAPKCLNNLISPKLKTKQLKFFESLGIIYTHQKSSWMDEHIFRLWYKDVFIPRVLEHQKTIGIEGKVVLILDNAPSHPNLDELNAINMNFEVVYLPPNVTPLIQPMNQGLISMTKKLYKKELLKRLLFNEKLQKVENFLKNLSLRDFLPILSLAWESLKSSTLQRVWKPLLGDWFVNNEDFKLDVPTYYNEPESPTDSSFSHEIVDQVSQLLTGPNCSVETSRDFLLKWFEDDHYDCGWEPLSDNDIVDFVTNDKCQPEVAIDIDEIENISVFEENRNNNRRIQNISVLDVNKKNNQKIENISEIPKLPEITSSEALEGLQKFKLWLKSLEKCSQLHLRYVEELENVITQETSKINV